MTDSKVYVGIDISKDSFDTYSPVQGHQKFENNKNGFNAFYQQLQDDYAVVMEATGSYYQQLAHFLYHKGVKVSIINPLVIKRFIQMKLKKTKTDKSDALMISKFGTEQQPKCWTPEPEYIENCKVIQATLNLYFKQCTALKNKLHSVQFRDVKNKALLASLRRQLKQLQKEIALLENELEQLVKTDQPQLLTNLSSIPGIGKKTAILLIVSSRGFKSFENPKQLSSYFGLAPAERSSGSSVRGRTRITKTGQVMVRNHLFLCSFTACMYNKECKTLYERIVAKGKSKKLALIAVCNKLLKQAFAIAHSGIPYDENFSSRLVVN